MLDEVPDRFLLDTGVSGTLIDPALAGPADLELIREEPIHFPSGPAGAIEHSLIGSLAIGPLLLQVVPAPTREAFAALLALPVEGIIGTVRSTAW